RKAEQEGDREADAPRLVDPPVDQHQGAEVRPQLEHVERQRYEVHQERAENGDDDESGRHRQQDLLGPGRHHAAPLRVFLRLSGASGASAGRSGSSRTPLRIRTWPRRSTPLSGWQVMRANAMVALRSMSTIFATGRPAG